VAERRAGRAAFGREGDGAQTEDGARRSDDPVESGAVDLLEILADFVVNVAREFPLVARLPRIGPDEALGGPDDAELEAAAERDGGPGPARHLDAAAADVDDHGDVTRHADAVDRRRMYEARFLGAGDQPRPDAGLGADRLQELAAVLRFARRTGGDRD